MRVDLSGPRGTPSSDVPHLPSSIGADAAKTSGGAAANAKVPPPTTSDDLNIRRTFDHVMTV